MTAYVVVYVTDEYQVDAIGPFRSYARACAEADDLRADIIEEEGGDDDRIRVRVVACGRPRRASRLRA